jgi:hypothetical protein
METAVSAQTISMPAGISFDLHQPQLACGKYDGEALRCSNPVNGGEFKNTYPESRNSDFA